LANVDSVADTCTKKAIRPQPSGSRPVPVSRGRAVDYDTPMTIAASVAATAIEDANTHRPNAGPTLSPRRVLDAWPGRRDCADGRHVYLAAFDMEAAGEPDPCAHLRT
jgi:hypothetical protein